MALSPDETRMINLLKNRIEARSATDHRLDLYYEGVQRLEHIGLAVPPELRRFETVVNWPRTYVDALRQRIQKKALILPGSEVADPGLEEGWEANNLDSESLLMTLDAFVYGRSFVAIGTNEEDAEHPLITVESPREMAVAFNPRTRRLDAVLRLYGGTNDEPDPDQATLYLPDVTIWLAKGNNGRWAEVLRDNHMLGRVPIRAYLNRRRTGRWFGVSEMADVISLTDAAARSLTNLQIAGETHSVPQKWVLGMSKGDFVDKDGTPIPAWQSYFTAIWANQNKEAKVGQFTASSLSNFHDTVNHYAQLAAGVTGLPMRYYGQNSANPPSGDGIRADESRLIKNAEMKCTELGDFWGGVAAFYLRFRDGDWVDGSRIKVEWHDPGTPTVAARADATVKLYQSKIVSREGAWDELGWSEARKIREQSRFDAEVSNDPVINAARGLMGEVTNPAAMDGGQGDPAGNA